METRKRTRITIKKQEVEEIDGNSKIQIGKEDGWEDGKCWTEEKNENMRETDGKKGRRRKTRDRCETEEKSIREEREGNGQKE